MGQRLVDDSTVDTRHEIAARLSVFAPPRVCVFRRSRRMNRENPPRCAESSRARASRVVSDRSTHDRGRRSEGKRTRNAGANSGERTVSVRGPSVTAVCPRYRRVCGAAEPANPVTGTQLRS